MEIKIRLMVENDIKDIVDLIINSEPWITYEFTDPEVVSLLFINNDRYDTYVIEVLEKEKLNFAGFIRIDINGIDDNSIILHNIAVKKAFRGEGVSDKAIEFVDKIAENNEKSFIFLITSDFNIPAITFFSKSGYKIYGHLNNYISDKTNEFTMYKDLELDTKKTSQKIVLRHLV